MVVVDFTDWLTDFTRPEVVWYVKRLSANDTMVINARHAGPYIQRDFLFHIFPSLNQPETENSDICFSLYIDSHAEHRTVRVVLPNNKFLEKTRNEARLTNFDCSASPLLDTESTGALAIFAFVRDEPGVPREAHLWVCETRVEEELAEYRIGWPVEPGQQLIWSPIHGSSFLSISKTT